MSGPDTLLARVRSSDALSAGLRRVVLEPAGDEPFPPAPAGAHAVLQLRHEERAWRNAYSLASPPGSRSAYTIIVRRVAQSRGGSTYVHEQLRMGDILTIGTPVNLFPVATQAHRHLMLAGGIGVTPFLSYLPQLDHGRSAYALYACCRTADASALRALLAPWPGAQVIAGADARALDVAAMLSAQPLGTHLYLCGPAPFMAHVEAIATALGWPAARLHREHFGGATSGRPFRATLARSGITVDVAAEQSLLEALERAGVDPPSLCRGGACGQCRLGVLAGTPDHHDHFLTATERARGDCIMPCVSRAQSATIMLDI